MKDCKYKKIRDYINNKPIRQEGDNNKIVCYECIRYPLCYEGKKDLYEPTNKIEEEKREK